jgi:hypothetical protein
MTKNKAQKIAEKNIKKHGGEKIKRGPLKGKWDMTKGVEKEKKGGKK